MIENNAVERHPCGAAMPEPDDQRRLEESAGRAESEPDEVLYCRYRDAGDTRAFESLVHRYERPLYSYLMRYLGNRELAEEVFQGTFLRLHEKRHLFTNDRRFRPWMYSIATHEAVDVLRREGRHQAVRLDERHESEDAEMGALLNLLASRVPTPMDQAAAHEQRAWARRAVDQLSEPLRAAVLLVFFQGLRYREVAEILRVPVGTVKSRIHKAMLQLNAAWRDEHPRDN